MKPYALLALLVGVQSLAESQPESRQGYYLGWADVSAVGRELRVSFNPIDCNVASLAAILPQSNGVLVAHFDLPSIASSEAVSEKEQGVIARRAQFVGEGTFELSTLPRLILGEEGHALRIEVPGGAVFARSELKHLKSSEIDRFAAAGFFEKVVGVGQRALEADPLAFLDPGAPTSSTRTSDIPTLAWLRSSTNTAWKSVSGLCHVLLFYGLGPTDLPLFPTGEAALKPLTDEQTAVQTFGRSPFVRTRNGLRLFLQDDPAFHTRVGEVHEDQCLATFGALGLPLGTPITLKTGRYSIADLLSETVANFDLEEREPAWTAIALANYLPPKKEWVNRFGERATFSRLAERLMQVDLNEQSCAGTHLFEALAKIDEADHRSPILDDESRRALDAYLRKQLEAAVSRQLPDGGWDWQWCPLVNPLPVGEKPSPSRKLLVTGHLLEVLNSLAPRRRPPLSVYQGAAQWVRTFLKEHAPPDDMSWLCPFTHAACCARRVLSASEEDPVAADTCSPAIWNR